MLFNNAFFSDINTLIKMTDLNKVKALGANYAMGLFSFEANRKLFLGHGGFYGSLLLYEPSDGITLAANIAQATPPYDTKKLVRSLLHVITE